MLPPSEEKMSLLLQNRSRHCSPVVAWCFIIQLEFPTLFIEGHLTLKSEAPLCDAMFMLCLLVKE